MIYLDTSAFVKLYIRESGSEEIQALVTAQHDPLPVSELQEMELTNALNLKVFWGDISAADADRLLLLFSQRRDRGLYHFPDLDRPAIMSNFRRLSHLTRSTGCRSLDILHVATALQLAPDLFVTFDERQATLAVQAGLNVPKF